MTTPFPEPEESLANELQAALMREFMGMPAVLNAMVEGSDGPVDLPPDQLAAALQKALFLLFHHTTRIAQEVDRLRWRAHNEDQSDSS